MPGGGLRAVRDVVTQAGWSFDDLLDDVEEGPSGAALDNQASTSEGGDGDERYSTQSDLL